MVTKFKLLGLSCLACQKVTQNRMGKIAGVTDVKVDLKTGMAEITAGRLITKEEVGKVLEGTTYQVA